MTRRQRHLNIIANFGGLDAKTVNHHLHDVMARRGLAALTDEAVEDLTYRIVSGAKRQRRYNREYRERLNTGRSLVTEAAA
jgi:hypothetical protein